MRAIEATINQRRGEAARESAIKLPNFRGIERRDFPPMIARLSLIIAEYQCNSVHRGEQPALAEFLPLGPRIWITCGNALRLDGLSVCPPTGTEAGRAPSDLLHRTEEAAASAAASPTPTPATTKPSSAST